MVHSFQNGSRTHVGFQKQRILASRGTVTHAPAAMRSLFVGRISSNRDLPTAWAIAVVVSLHKRGCQDTFQGIRQTGNLGLFVFHVNHLLSFQSFHQLKESRVSRGVYASVCKRWRNGKGYLQQVVQCEMWRSHASTRRVRRRGTTGTD